MAHTPGPWELEKSGSPTGFHVRGPQNAVAFVYRWEDAQHRIPEYDANARLIAAAPDLLAACSEAYISLPMTEHNKEINAALLAAITKARGTFVS